MAGKMVSIATGKINVFIEEVSINCPLINAKHITKGMT